MTESLLIGLNALRAHQRAMEITSHNIANASTPGYSRQRAELQAPAPEDNAVGQLGRGVDVVKIKRLADQFIGDRLRDSQSEGSRLKTIRDRLSSLETAFNEPGENGLSAITEQLFSVYEELAGNPESAALRSAAVQEMQTWTSTVNSLGDTLTILDGDARSAAGTEVAAINDLAEQISSLNQQVRRVKAGGGDPNDLLDQRDRLLGDLAERVDIRTREDATGAVSVDIQGHRLVGTGGFNRISAVGVNGGHLAIQAPSGGTLHVSGGSLGALVELSRGTLPQIKDALDGFIATFARLANAVHAAGTSHATHTRIITGDVVVPDTGVEIDLDDPSLAPSAQGGNGVPSAFRPSFVGGDGQAQTRNLVINVVEDATGLARKHVIRYDPTTGTGGRSMQDLIGAINTGSGGGFTLVAPTDRIGVPHLSAQAVPSDGGYRLRLAADQGYSVDFSSALDLRISGSRWSGGTVAVDDTTALDPDLGQLQFTVEEIPGAAGALRLAVTSRSGSDGSVTSHGTVALGVPGTASVIVGAGAIDITTGPGPWKAGDSFTVQVDPSSGQVRQRGSTVVGTYNQPNERGFADTTVDVKGRYTGALAFAADPTGQAQWMQWSMRVTRGGQVGVEASADATAAQPPEVEFTYWTGEPGAATKQTKRVVLDQTHGAGSPVEIADGVYASFGKGLLTQSAAGTAMDFTIDAQGDQAGLLTALGIQGMFTGSTASGLRVADRLAEDPSQLAVARTRSQGDNSNLLALTAVRRLQAFSGGTFTMEDSYQAVLSDLGSRIAQADRLGENQSAIGASLQHRRDEASGVNIDEEVGRLILEQQAYTASARVVTTARENIQTLLDLLR